MTPCDQQITAQLKTCGDTSADQPLPPKAHRHKKTDEPRCAARTPLSRLAGVDLTTIEGSEDGTALVILSEIGTDMPRWPRVKPCWSWLGLCPQHQIAGGKVLSRRVRPGAPRVTVALRLAASSLHHSQSALRGLLPADESASRHPQSHPSHSPHAGSAGLELLATRPRLRPTGPRCLRSAVPRAQGHRQGHAGQGPGRDVGATRGAGLMIAPLAMLILPECLHAPATQRVARAAGQV